VGNSRLLGTLALYYATTGDEVWNQTGRGVVDRLKKLAFWLGAMGVDEHPWVTANLTVSTPKQRPVEFE
jgi:hypothetical protein